MFSEEKSNETEKLTRLLSSLQELYYNKKEQLEVLKDEIIDLKEIINQLNDLISGKSFASADQLYSKASQAEVSKKYKKEKSESDFFESSPSSEQSKGTEIKRKIFSKGTESSQNLLAILNYVDMDIIEIKLIEPETIALTETNEIFIQEFLMGALVSIKEHTPELELQYQYYKNTDIIEKIEITNVRSVDDYDLITNKISEILKAP